MGRKLFIVIKLPVLVYGMAMVCFCADRACSSADCLALINRNEFDSAQACVQKALAKNPSDRNCQLANAKLMENASAARAVYKRLVAAATCPDTLRAEAYYRLACHSYMMANYIKAELYCKGAYGLDKKIIYKRLYVQCARLNNHDSLSQALLQEAPSSSAAEQNQDTLQQASAPDKAAPGPVFYLQAGAFSTMENAQALRAELKRFCANVSVVAAISNERNIYRVRVGAFDSKESAQAYGDSTLMKRNVSFRIVEE